MLEDETESGKHNSFSDYYVSRTHLSELYFINYFESASVVSSHGTYIVEFVRIDKISRLESRLYLSTIQLNSMSDGHNFQVRLRWVKLVFSIAPLIANPSLVSSEMKIELFIRTTTLKLLVLGSNSLALDCWHFLWTLIESRWKTIGEDWGRWLRNYQLLQIELLLVSWACWNSICLIRIRMKSDAMMSRSRFQISQLLVCLTKPFLRHTNEIWGRSSLHSGFLIDYGGATSSMIIDCCFGTIPIIQATSDNEDTHNTTGNINAKKLTKMLFRTKGNNDDLWRLMWSHITFYHINGQGKNDVSVRCTSPYIEIVKK